MNFNTIKVNSLKDTYVSNSLFMYSILYIVQV